MYLNFAFLASAAEIMADGRLGVLGGDFDSVQFPKLPFRLPVLNLVAKIAFEQAECSREHVISVSIHGPQGQPAIRKPAAITIQPEISARGTSNASLILEMNGILFSHEGEHAVKIAVNGDEIGSVPLFVELPEE